jgi:hypothetical protein
VRMKCGDFWMRKLTCLLAWNQLCVKSTDPGAKSGSPSGGKFFLGSERHGGFVLGSVWML